MLKFLVYRVATIVPVLFGVSIVVFLMMKLVPGDPAEAILGPAATTEKIEMVRKALGLDQPFYVQYFRWLWKVLQGDFGTSIAVNVPVAQLVWPKFWNTVLLTAGSLVICVVIGLGVGIVSGTRQYSWFDRISMSLTLVVANTPAFWLGLILMVVLALYLGWFPATGMYSMRASQKTFGDLIHHMVLPAITTASVSAAIIARLVRSSFLDVIRKHYITALRAKGLSERDIILRHGMKNALPPIINIVGLQVGYLMGGALFTEVVFSWPGIGLQIYSSIVARDLPVVQAAVLVTTFVFVLVNLGTDIVVAALDPRIRRA
jgi:peptide/nickel transport system permease protein